MSVKINNTVHNKQSIIHYGLITLGIALSLIQYCYNRSLWLDEACLANNIIERNYSALLKPLDYNQVAPILFLQFVKFFSSLLPNSELGLRLFPLISYSASLFLFYRLSKSVLKSNTAISLALSLFVFNSSLLYYSSELKQYMVDVFVLLVLYVLAIKKSGTTLKHYLFLAIAGIISIFLSNVSPIILLTCGAYLIYSTVKHKHKNTSSLIYLSALFATWVITFLIYYLLFINSHPTKGLMLDYWANSFLPSNPLSVDFYVFLWNKTNMIFFSLLPFNAIGYLFICLSIVGAITLFLNKQYGYIILLFVPLTVHLILSAIKLYPFDLRLILYATPIVILAISVGFERLTELKNWGFSDRKKQYLAILLPSVFLISFVCFRTFPLKNEEIKSSLTFINEKIEPNDNLYVYYGSQQAFNYYYNTGYFKPSNSLIMGLGSREDRTKYIEQIKPLNGRTWLLFSHVYEDEEEDIVQQMNAIGYSKLDSLKTNGSSAYLYLLQ